MTPTAAAAKELRKALKTELGLGPRQVSVRTDNYSMGSSIDVTIKAPGILRSKVEEVAKRFARVHYCESSGEVLGGGNRFVGVEYSSELRAELEERYADRLPAEGEYAALPGGGEVQLADEYFYFRRSGEPEYRCWGTRLASLRWAELELEAADAAPAEEPTDAAAVAGLELGDLGIADLFADPYAILDADEC